MCRFYNTWEGDLFDVDYIFKALHKLGRYLAPFSSALEGTAGKTPGYVMDMLHYIRVWLQLQSLAQILCPSYPCAGV
jgi:hypothetical protein